MLKAYDPEAMERAASVLPGVELCRTADEVAEGVDALVVATEWPEFKKLDWQKLLERMSRPLVLDCRNLLDCRQDDVPGLRVLLRRAAGTAIPKR